MVGDLLSRDSGGKKRKSANVHLYKEQPTPAIFAVDAVGPALDNTAITQHTMLREYTNEGERLIESDESHHHSHTQLFLDSVLFSRQGREFAVKP